MVLAMTGAFRTTNTVKLLDLLGILDIEREVKYLTECRDPDADREKIKKKHLDDQRPAGAYASPFEVKQLRRKESIWFITKHGPFRYQLVRTGGKGPSVCRFCIRRLEDADHLFSDCDELEPTVCTTAAEFEDRCCAIVRRIFESGK